ncbi:hypothetical protein A0H81_07096 [Grifola frondosa]|uniref:Uncharacterized protein n=1 Tax=Grifola frondosa TaxID=5627 RepID=A0A1C7M8B3_GRIFR|nr:hypothetical protein A0H81_07096 [Grifola frondosa]
MVDCESRRNAGNLGMWRWDKEVEPRELGDNRKGRGAISSANFIWRLRCRHIERTVTQSRQKKKAPTIAPTM